MGFLDNLLKKEVRKSVSNILTKAIDTVGDSISDAISSAPTSGQASAVQTSGSKARGTEAVVRERIEEIIARDFPSLELRRDVPASEMNAQTGARNYTYGLYLDGQPKAMIMLLDEDNHNLYRNSKITKAKRACESAGVPYMNFMLYMSNRPEYIAERFKNTIVL